MAAFYSSSSPLNGIDLIRLATNISYGIGGMKTIIARHIPAKALSLQAW